MNRKFVVLAIAIMFLMAPIVGANAVKYSSNNTFDQQSVSNVTDNSSIKSPLSDFLNNDVSTSMIDTNYTSTNYPKNWDFIKYLSDNPNEYKKIWEPWLTKAAIHAIALSPDRTFLAVGGGYLYDNEIHIYRWNYMTSSYDKVWDSGDGIIQGDILSLAIDDTDNNQLMEIIAGSADGHIYVFEQRHIYDPITNTENMFDLVWKSEFIGPVWAVGVFDADKDYVKDIIAGSWYDKVYFYEYYNHSRYPFTPEHWIDYRLVWDSGETINSHVTSLGFGDLNGNGLPDVVVGLRNGGIVILENNGTVIDMDGYMFPLTQDNSYNEIWRDTDSAFTPILRISVNDTDGDGVDEASIVAVTLGAYILDYYKPYDMFRLIKLYYPPMPYEVGLGVRGEYPIDNWMDWMVYGNNVYYYNGTVNMTEPIENYREKTGIEFNNTAMGGPADGEFSRFLSNSTINATAILDFGVQEEAVGDGSNASDIWIIFRYYSGFSDNIARDKIKFYVSYDGVKYVELTNYTVSKFAFEFRVYFDIDPILANYSWRHIRYLKIYVYNGGKYAIDAIYTKQIDKQLTDVVSTLITPLKIDYGNVKNYILFGTIQGKIIIYFYNSTSMNYEMLYDSYYEDNFILNTHIWYMVKTMVDKKYPYWIKDKGYTFDLAGNVFNFYDLYDLDKDGDLDLIVGTLNNGIMYYDRHPGGFVRNAFVENYVFGQVNSLLSGKSYFTVRMGDILPKPGPELIVSFYDSVTDAFDSYLFYLENQYNLSYLSTAYYSLSNAEITSKLKEIFQFRDLTDLTIPSFDFGDADGDGKIDLLLTKGKIYLLKSLGTSPPTYVLDESYLSDINENTKRFLLNARFVDFNKDGVLDIISSYYGKKGSTYYENVGTSDDPKWVEKKQLFANSVRSMNPVTNFAFNNFTLSIVLYDEDSDTFTLVAYNLFDQKIYYFNGEKTNIDTLAIATYPLLMEINFGPMFSDTKHNFGYHIIEVWSTREELRGWTQAVAHADLDGDGKGEIIIGDFDNNVYVFEHLTNNTYKRAYRTRDLYYEFETNLSPYYSEELGGLQGTFKRRVWEHARYIAADTDIDGDGKLEMIVATKYQIFVFEHIKYENYELAYQYSLLDHPLWSNISLITDGISAFAYAGDMDYNGYGEVVVAAGGFLFVLELASNGSFIETFNYLAFKSAIETLFYAIIGGDAPRTPTYLLPGNMFTYLYDYIFENDFENYMYLEINALAVDDIDNNGNKEIFIGGRNRSYNCAPCSDGLLYVIENVFGTYYLKWIAPENVTWRNAINSIVIDDQDYDGYKELIIGGTKGIDIFEHSDTSYLVYLKSITSSLNHPFKKNSIIINGTTPYSNYQLQSNDLVVLPNGRIVSFFVSYYSEAGMSSEIYYAYSDDNGTTWSGIMPLTGGSGYGATVNAESFITAVNYYKDEIHLAWYVAMSDVTSKYAIYYAVLNGTDFSFISGPLEIVSESSNFLSSLRIWRYPVGILFSYYDVGISYYNNTDYKYYFYVYYHYWSLFGWIHEWIPHPNMPSMSFHIYDVYYMTYMHDIAYIGNNEWIMVFTGLNMNKSYTGCDVLAMKANSTFNWSRPVEVYSSIKWDLDPVVDYYETTDTVIAMFMSPISAFKYDIYASSSRDGGVTWTEARNVYKWHPNIVEMCNVTMRYYWQTRTGSLKEIAKHDTSLLAMGLNSKGEFAFSYATWIRYYIAGKWDDIYDIVFGYRSDVDWANTLLGEVKVLAVGDSDKDNRREIVSNYFEDGFTVFEVTSSKTNYRKYNQTFIFEHLNNTVFDISIGDSNGNNWPEIVVATNFGNVYSFEFKYSNWLATSIVIPKLEKTWNVMGGPVSVIDFATDNFDSDKSLEYFFTHDGNKLSIYDIESGTLNTLTLSANILQPLVADVDGNGVSEIIVSLDNTTLVILDGQFKVLNKTTGFYAKRFSLRTGYLAVVNESAYIIIYNISTLKVLWEFDSKSSSSVRQVAIAFDRNNISKIIVSLDNNTLYAVDYAFKNITWSILLKKGNVDFILSDLNNNGRDEIIGQNYTYFYYPFGGYSWSSNVSIIDSKDGDILHNIEVPFDYQFVRMDLVNIDNDSYEDIFVISERGVGVITTKDYEFIWFKKFGLDINRVSLGDFNDDGFLDYLVSLYNAGEFLLSNSYGNVFMYYSTESTVNMYLVIDDYDQDGSSEIYGLLSNGTFIVVKSVGFSEKLSGTAYMEPYLESTISTFGESSSGFIFSADFDGDDFEEVAVSNSTHLALISAKNDTVLWLTAINTTIVHMTVGEYRHAGEYVIAVSDWDNVSIFNVYGERIFHRKIANLYSNWYITQLHLGDFDGDGVGELIVVTNIGTYMVDNNEPSLSIGVQGITYTIIGDFDGDGMMEIAYKYVSTGYLLVMNIDNTGLWGQTIGSTKATRMLPDIFTLDYNNDGYDDIVFTNSSGEIDVFDGLTGYKYKVIPTGIKSYGLSVDHDRLYGVSGSIIVKYANYGFYVFDSSGNIVFEFKDKSTAAYYGIDADSDGHLEYFAMTCGKVFGLWAYGLAYYNNLMDVTYGMTTINEGTANAKKIAVIGASGNVYIIKLANAVPKEVTRTDNPKSNTISILAYSLIMYLPMIVIAILPQLIYLRRKRKKSP